MGGGLKWTIFIIHWWVKIDDYSPQGVYDSTNLLMFILPSSDVKIAVEDGHWKNEFTNETWWFKPWLWQFTKGQHWWIIDERIGKLMGDELIYLIVPINIFVDHVINNLMNFCWWSTKILTNINLLTVHIG